MGDVSEACVGLFILPMALAILGQDSQAACTILLGVFRRSCPALSMAGLLFPSTQDAAGITDLDTLRASTGLGNDPWNAISAILG